MSLQTASDPLAEPKQNTSAQEEKHNDIRFWDGSIPEDRGHRSQTEVRQIVFEYIEAYYNRERLHSLLGYQSPVEFEKQTPQDR